MKGPARTAQKGAQGLAAGSGEGGERIDRTIVPEDTGAANPASNGGKKARKGKNKNGKGKNKQAKKAKNSKNSKSKNP